MTAPTRPQASASPRRGTTALIVGALSLVAFGLRVAVSYRAVMGQEYVAFIENDAWYHMRTVDALVRHFPRRIWHDAYLLHPGGDVVNTGPMLDWIIALVALILGLGAPSAQLVDRVGAFVPPVIGALTIAPVYFIGRDLFSVRAGLWAAVCAAVMPGAFFIRSALGFADHHCVEVWLTTLTIMFMVRAVDSTRSDKSRRTQALVAGVALGAYLLTWGGGALFVAALSAWAVIELLHARYVGQQTPYLTRSIVVAFGVAALMTLPWLGTRPYFGYALLALVGGTVVVVALQRLAGWTASQPRGRTRYFAAVGLVATAGAIVFALASPTLLRGLLSEMQRLSPWRPGGVVSEAAPLMRSAAWRPVPLWSEFTTSLPLSMIGLLAGLFSRADRSPAVRLILVWGGVTLAATFGQARFAYYLAIPVAVFAGFGCDRVLTWLIGERASARPWPTVATVCLAAAIVAPGSAGMIRKSNIRAPLGPDWFDALQWMRTNTPEPFGSPDAYYEGVASATSSYGVLSWWDFGYWITRVARRVPIANPRQSGLADTARFLLSRNPREASNMLEQLGARYVIADAMLQFSVSRSPRDPGFFASIASAGGQPPQRFCEALRPPGPDTGGPLLYCYADYYQTMAVRLYAFAGKAVTPQSIWVVDIERSQTDVPKIRSEWSFPTYDEALRFSQLRPAGQLRVVSKDPRSSCIPLDALPDFVQVYRSVGQQQSTSARPATPLVQIYEFRPQG